MLLVWCHSEFTLRFLCLGRKRTTSVDKVLKEFLSFQMHFSVLRIFFPYFSNWNRSSVYIIISTYSISLCCTDRHGDIFLLHIRENLWVIASNPWGQSVCTLSLFLVVAFHSFIDFSCTQHFLKCLCWSLFYFLLVHSSVSFWKWTVKLVSNKCVLCTICLSDNDCCSSLVCYSRSYEPIL